MRLLALLLLVGVHRADLDAVAGAIRGGPHPVTREVVAAIIEHESRGNPHACREDRGGSSRGLMQIWHPRSRCTAADDARFDAEYSAGQNVGIALRLLAAQRAWHVQHCRHPHDPLEHYAGRGPDARRFARDIRRRARQLRAKKG